MLDKYAGKKAVITGGLGFIGSNLAKSLVDAGCSVTIVDNLAPEFGGNEFNVEDIKGNVEIHLADIRDLGVMSKLIEGQDYLFSLAGQTSHVASMREPQLDLEINSLAQLNLLEICKEENRDIKIVFTSTRQLYGKPEFLPLTENHPINPVDNNGINKFSGELFHLLYHRLYGIRSSILRLTNTYGPRMRVKRCAADFYRCLGAFIITR